MRTPTIFPQVLEIRRDLGAFLRFILFLTRSLRGERIYGILKLCLHIVRIKKGRCPQMDIRTEGREPC